MSGAAGAVERTRGPGSTTRACVALLCLAPMLAWAASESTRLPSQYWPAGFYDAHPRSGGDSTVYLEKDWGAGRNHTRYYATTGIQRFENLEKARSYFASPSDRELMPAPEPLAGADACLESIPEKRQRGELNDRVGTRLVCRFGLLKVTIAVGGFAWLDSELDGRGGVRHVFVKPTPTRAEILAVAQDVFNGAVRFAEARGWLAPAAAGNTAGPQQMFYACDDFADGIAGAKAMRQVRVARSGERIWLYFEGQMNVAHSGFGQSRITELWALWEGTISGGTRVTGRSYSFQEVRGLFQGTIEGFGSFSATLDNNTLAGRNELEYRSDFTLDGSPFPGGTPDPRQCEWRIDSLDLSGAGFEPGRPPTWLQEALSAAAAAGMQRPATPPASGTADAPIPAAGIDQPEMSPTRPTSPGALAAASLAAGGVAALGAWLMLGAAGVGRREAMESVRDLLGTGSGPWAEYDAWRRKYEAMGWRYSEHDGVGEFEPVQGAVNEDGWVYDPSRGEFLAPEPAPGYASTPHDGETNAAGEVWSDEDRGWVSRNLYEQERARRESLAARDEAEWQAMRGQDPRVREAHEAWLASREEGRRLREARRAAALEERKAELRNEIERHAEHADAALGAQSLGSLWLRNAGEDIAQFGGDVRDGALAVYDAATDPYSLDAVGILGEEVAVAARDMVTDPYAGEALVGMVRNSAAAVGEAAENVLADPKGSLYDGTVLTGQLCAEVFVKPVTNIVDESKSLAERAGAVYMLTVDVAGGAAGAGLVDDVVLRGSGRAGELLSDLGSARTLPAGRQAAMSELMDRKTRVMQRLNDIADTSDATVQQSMFAALKKEDSALINLVKDELHPETGRVIKQLTQELNEGAWSRTAVRIENEGYTVEEVLLAGKRSGADSDAYFKIRGPDGKMLSEADTRTLVQRHHETTFAEDFSHLDITPAQADHVIVNASPEKFAASPNDLGIRSARGALDRQQGALVFEEVPRTGGHWTDTPWKTSPGARLADGVVSDEMIDSLETVCRTKTDHLRELGRAPTREELVDLGRELTKTRARTIDPLADKLGAELTPEYKALMREMGLAQHVPDRGMNLPDLDRIDEIVRGQIDALRRAGGSAGAGR